MASSGIINIVAWDNGAGLSKDIDVLERAIQALGWEVRYNGRIERTVPTGLMRRMRSRMERAMRRAGVAARLSPPPYDINLFLEDISPASLGLAHANILIPNPEFLRPSSLPFLTEMDFVFAKTRHAERIFAERGCVVHFLGFASEDKRVVPSLGDSSCAALHLAGRSLLKGTEQILDAWSRHPEWPRLTVVRNAYDYTGARLPWQARLLPPNVELIERQLDDAEISELQNRFRVHIATSESEGFGHSIVEGLSVGAIVITTDAPPMNELVCPDHGVLVKARSHIPHGAGHRYVIDPRDFDRAIEELLRRSPEERLRMQERARRRYEVLARDLLPNLQQGLRRVVPVGEVRRAARA